MRTIRKHYWVSGLVIVALAGLAVGLLRPTPLAGPWRAQIVDAETGQPLEGVIVLALWDKRSFGWPHPDRNYHDIDEVVSDKDGRIVIPARDTSGRHPFEKIIGPLVTVFKPGYANWRFQSTPEGSVKANWERFAREGVVIVVPRAKTRDERLHMLSLVLPGMEVPIEKIPRALAAYNQESIHLGLQPR